MYVYCTFDYQFVYRYASLFMKLRLHLYNCVLVFVCECVYGCMFVYVCVHVCACVRIRRRKKTHQYAGSKTDTL